MRSVQTNLEHIQDCNLSAISSFKILLLALGMIRPLASRMEVKLQLESPPQRSTDAKLRGSAVFQCRIWPLGNFCFLSGLIHHL